MHDQSPWIVVLNVAVAAAAGCGLTVAARRVALRIGMVDHPDASRKVHAHPTPLLGGVAVFGAAAIAFAVAWFSGQQWIAASAPRRFDVLMILISGGLYCAVGLWDDARGLRPRTKFLLQIVAGLPFIFGCCTIQSIQLLGEEFTLGPFGAVFTIFWLAACSNVINLVDGLDGLAGTVGLIICVAAGAHAGFNGDFGLLMIALIVSGAMLGFLTQNWPPAKIFLGDAGSLLIGFFVGMLSIESSMKTATGFALAVPLVLVSVPVFDTFMAIVRRKLNGRCIGEADRGHIHHCLQDRGLTRFQSLVAIAGLCVAMAAVALVSGYLRNDLLAMCLCLAILGLLVAGRVFGYAETVLFFRYLQTVSGFLGESSGILRTRFLLTRMTYSTPVTADMWLQLTHHARCYGASSIELDETDLASENRMLRWRWSDENSPEDAVRLDRKRHKSPTTKGRRFDAPHSADQWQLSYSTLRSDNVRITLTITGSSSEASTPAFADELFQTMAAFCRRWEPADELPATLPLHDRRDAADVSDADRHAA